MIVRHLIPCVVLCIAAAASLPGAAASAKAQAPSPVRTPQRSALIAPEAAIRIAVERLRAEGRAFRATGNLPRQTPDFARSYPYRVRAEDIIEAIVTVQDREDAAVDAYMRWQLLSFKADLAGMDGRSYDRLLANLPKLARHPASDPAFHMQFEHLAPAAGRSAQARVDLEQRWDSLRFEARQIELLNQPALKFRDAVADAMPATGARLLGILLCDLQDRILAASSTRALKSRLTRTLRQRISDDTLSLAQRWELIKFIERLPGPETKAVRRVVFYADAPADILYSTFAIRATDVSKWTAYLNRHEP